MYCPWFRWLSHGHCAATAASTSAGHEPRSDFPPSFAHALVGSARIVQRSSTRCRPCIGDLLVETVTWSAGCERCASAPVTSATGTGGQARQTPDTPTFLRRAALPLASARSAPPPAQ